MPATMCTLKFGIVVVIEVSFLAGAAMEAGDYISRTAWLQAAFVLVGNHYPFIDVGGHQPLGLLGGCVSLERSIGQTSSDFELGPKA